MKKIGILFGKERSFPMAFIEKVNSKGIDGVLQNHLEWINLYRE
jgi:hypothetical protein